MPIDLFVGRRQLSRDISSLFISEAVSSSMIFFPYIPWKLEVAASNKAENNGTSTSWICSKEIVSF